MQRRFSGDSPGSLLLAYVLAVLLGSCGGSAPPQPPPSVGSLDHIYDKATTRLIVEIDYQTGGEPYTGPLIGSSDTWDVFANNAMRLFQSAGKTVQVPRTLAEMEALTDLSGTTFTAEQILAIAQKHRGQQSVGDVASFYVVFLNGYF